jgi:NAD(P)-dependent dehydrogenase (short-subunit alcohol dehydrogenase family)
MLTQEPLPIFTDDRGVRGSIVNTASVSGTSALPDLSAYNSSKHAVGIMTRVDAR